MTRAAVAAALVLRGGRLILDGDWLTGVCPTATISKYEMVINLKTAKALGVSIPPLLLVRDQVID